MYAVIETGGKQYRVQEGDVLNVEKLNAEAGEKIEFTKVLALSDDNGLTVGKPYIENAKVEAEVVANGKAQKVIIFKYKSKKDYRKKQGHRQPFTTVEIKSLGGTEEKKAEPEKKVSTSMKKDELIAYAEEHSIEIDEKATKAEIVEAIEKAEK
ncbi:large subunit ribosomal protein L21 [Eubacterium pyruvativorans]|uniref:Large ribosomal subunit protein bL21 n=1 Tax=Eubacterium pyruvativorans TaxID=155865 RepID=A0A1I7EXC2_9FIRM|nr:ribosomal protein L21 [Eubacterium pyruvativorans]SFN91079.1 large subunit ribosomal protein L21 [Eubacterium pyruvativorans]SFU28598.1 large subunit ribosomal protein L21 [Eubacterium pyruvativorans]HAT82968.1 50S ribosomal protein L21 [Eubacterium sp.]